MTSCVTFHRAPAANIHYIPLRLIDPLHLGSSWHSRARSSHKLIIISGEMSSVGRNRAARWKGTDKKKETRERARRKGENERKSAVEACIRSVGSRDEGTRDVAFSNLHAILILFSGQIARNFRRMGRWPRVRILFAAPDVN